MFLHPKSVAVKLCLLNLQDNSEALNNRPKLLEGTLNVEIHSLKCGKLGSREMQPVKGSDLHMGKDTIYNLYHNRTTINSTKFHISRAPPRPSSNHFMLIGTEMAVPTLEL